MTTPSKDRKSVIFHLWIKSCKTFVRICRSFVKSINIRYVWLFGSFVRGKQHRHSDLDVLVEFEETPTLPKFISLEHRLREITGIKVDLVSIRALRGEIGERILREKVAL